MVLPSLLPLESDKKVCNRPDNDRSCWLLVRVYVLVCRMSRLLTYIWSRRVEVVEVTLVGDCTHWCHSCRGLYTLVSLLSGIVHNGVTLVGDCIHWCKLNRDRVDTHAGLGLNISMLKLPRSKMSLWCLLFWNLSIMITNSSNQTKVDEGLL